MGRKELREYLTIILTSAKPRIPLFPKTIHAFTYFLDIFYLLLIFRRLIVHLILRYVNNLTLEVQCVCVYIYILLAIHYALGGIAIHNE